MFNNSLKGSLPPEYSAWGAGLNVSINEFSGTLPADYSNWTHCDNFDVGKNKLSGSLPQAYSLLPMANFLANDNLLTGSIPSAYSSRGSNVGIFNVARNQLNGTLPPQLANWTTLRFFVAYNNNTFSGTLPPQYGAWQMRVQFDCSLNSLEWNASSRICQLDDAHDVFCT